MIETEPGIVTLEMIREELSSALLSDALDSLGLRYQSPAVSLRPITVAAPLAGWCRTMLWADMAHDEPRPYELELQAVDACQPDDVLICAAGSSMRSGIWGELLTTAARNRGCVGVVIDGAVRDVVRMREMKFPVYALGTRIYDSLHRQRVIDLDVPVEVGGVRIERGDLIFADEDGVVIVPRRVHDECIRRAWRKRHAENTTRDSIRGGMLAADAYARFGVL